MLVVGRREAVARSVALRRLGGKEQEVLALGEAVARLKKEAAVPSSSLRSDPIAVGTVHPREESVNS
jgi:threonyl-tRNA synthetase